MCAVVPGGVVRGLGAMLVSRRAEMMPKLKLVLASFLGICAAIIVRQICAAIQTQTRRGRP